MYWRLTGFTGKRLIYFRVCFHEDIGSLNGKQKTVQYTNV